MSQAPESGERNPVVGEVRPVTILYADIVGSTKLIQRLDLDKAREIIDEGLGEVRRAVNLMGGHVVRIQGDGLMAVFGATMISEDHPWRAVLAANMIRSRYVDNLANDPQSLKIRVGVHSGPIYLRWQHHDFGAMLDAVGPTAHIAARIESACPPNSIATSDSTLLMLHETVETQFLSRVDIEESNTPIEIHEIGEIDAPTDPTRRLNLHGQSALVGRTEEWERIQAVVEGMRAGTFDALAILGGAGMGKSRLLDEASHFAARSSLNHIIVRGRQLQSRQPFGALRTLFAQLVDFAGAESESAIKNYLNTIGFADDTADYLFDTLGGDKYRPNTEQKMLPDKLQKTIIHGLIQLIENLAAKHPLLLLFDDLQYLDGASEKFIAELIRQQHELNVAILLFGRMESSQLVSELKLDTLSLRPLDEDHSHQLITNLLGDGDHENPTAENLVKEIADRCDGLPLALTEFSRFASHQALDTEEKLALPPKIETVFRARIDRLSASERKLCDIACVLGTEMHISHLKLMTDLLGGEFEITLQSLFNQTILIERMNGRLQFSHQLFQESVYAALAKQPRQQLHKDVYHRLVETAAISVPHIDLAHHAHFAGLFQPALKHYWHACEEAVAHSEIRSVVQIYKEARTLCHLIGSEAQLTASRFAMFAFDAAQQLTEQEECHADLEAITSGTVKVDDNILIVANAHQAMVNWIGGRGAAGLVNAQEANAALSPDTPLAARWYAEFTLGILEYSNSLPQQGLKRLENVVLELSDGNLEKKFGTVISIPGFLARAFGGWIASDLGEFEVARKLCVEAIAIADRLNHNNSRLIGRIAEGHYHLRYNDGDQAVAILTEAYEICRKHGFDGYEPSTSSRLGMALLQQGNVDQAFSVVKRSLDLGIHNRIINSSSYLLYDAEARILHAMGKTDQAIPKIEKAIRRCEALGDGVQAAFANLLNLQMHIKLHGWQEDYAARLRDLRSGCRKMGLERLVAEIDDMFGQQS